MPLVHHELCFGCGRTNLFGLLLEVEQTGQAVAGRCFIKQDHQGPDRGIAHEGVLAAALSEAMALAGGPEMRVRRLEIEFSAPAAVGTFVDVQAEAHGLSASATASVQGTRVARARGDLRR